MISLRLVSRSMRSLKTYDIEKIPLNNNILSNKYTKTNYEITDVVVGLFKFKWILTPSSNISIVNFEPVFVYWVNFKCYFLIQKLLLKFWSKWRRDELVPVVWFFSRKSVSSISVSLKHFFKPSWTSEMELFCENS